MNIDVGDTKIIYYDRLYYKMETSNPTGSIKDRAAYNILKHYWELGKLKKGDTIIEASSGNLGISLAYFGKLFGLKVIIVMPDNVSVERFGLLRKYQAKVIKVRGDLWKCQEIAKYLCQKCSFLLIDQFNNNWNKEAHFKTGKEILADLPDVDYVIVGIGSSGTISGIAEYIQDQGVDIKIIGVEPYESAVLSGRSKGVHLIQGIGAGFIPSLFDLKLIDKIECVKSEEVIQEFKNNNPLELGLSSIALRIIARRILKDNPTKKILVIVADGKERYESMME